MKKNYFNNFNIEKKLINIKCIYEIVDKEETKALNKSLEKCKTLEKAFTYINGDISPTERDITLQTVNKSIIYELNRMFNFYCRHYTLELEDNCVNENIEKICLHIKSWEE